MQLDGRSSRSLRAAVQPRTRPSYWVSVALSAPVFAGVAPQDALVDEEPPQRRVVGRVIGQQLVHDALRVAAAGLESRCQQPERRQPKPPACGQSHQAPVAEERELGVANVGTRWGAAHENDDRCVGAVS